MSIAVIKTVRPGTVIIRSAFGISRTDVVAEDRDGFRLPTSIEWELAARYKGSDSSHGAIEYPVGSGKYWTPGNYASGATGPAWHGNWRHGEPGDEEATKAVTWYMENSDKTQDFGQKPEEGNGLGLFDMSGNVWEWCFTKSRSERVVRGGSWGGSSFSMQVGMVLGSIPSSIRYSYGLRLLRMQF